MNNNNIIIIIMRTRGRVLAAHGAAVVVNGVVGAKE
jgi:hypothetical protein